MKRKYKLLLTISLSLIILGGGCLFLFKLSSTHFENELASELSILAQMVITDEDSLYDELVIPNVEYKGSKPKQSQSGNADDQLFAPDTRTITSNKTLHTEKRGIDNKSVEAGSYIKSRRDIDTYISSANSSLSSYGKSSGKSSSSYSEGTSAGGSYTGSTSGLGSPFLAPKNNQNEYLVGPGSSENMIPIPSPINNGAVLLVLMAIGYGIIRIRK